MTTYGGKWNISYVAKNGSNSSVWTTLPAATNVVSNGLNKYKCTVDIGAMEAADGQYGFKVNAVPLAPGVKVVSAAKYIDGIVVPQ